MRKIFLIFFLCLLVPTRSFGEDLYEEQLDRGIRNSDPYAYVLIKQAKTNPSEAKEILKKALTYAPDLPAVYFELSKASFSLSSKGIFETIDYMIKGITAYERNFWWSFTTAGSLFMSFIISFILAMIIIILIRLPHDIPLLAHDIKEIRTKAGILLLLIFALTGPLLLIGGMLIIIGLYMKKVDRVVVYLYLLFLLISPLIFNTATMFFQVSASNKLKAVVQVNESKDNQYALSILRDSDDDIELFSYALALKRDGRYTEAIDIYNRLIEKRPSPQLYNNLANCYVAMNEMEKAKKVYTKSIEMKPIPSAVYNLSQVWRETFDFEKGDEYISYAQRLDQNAVSRFRTIFGRNPNRFVIDEVMPSSAFWKYSHERTADTSTMGLSIAPISFMPVASISFMILFAILTKRIKNRAFRCKKCGTILCNICEKRILWNQMCPICYRSLIKLDELDARKRVSRLLTVYDYQTKNRNTIKALSFILPGSAQIYAGNILSGFLFLWSFLFFLFIPVTNSIFVMETSYFSHLWLNVSAVLLMAVVFFVSNIITQRRLAKGWL